MYRKASKTSFVRYGLAMQHLSRLGLLACSFALGCGAGKTAEQTTIADATTNLDTTESSAGDGDGDGDGDSADEETEGSEDTTAFIQDDFAVCGVCDTFLQDCPDGEKCVPGPDLGGSCGPPSCKPVIGDKQSGEPCTVVGTADDCDEGSWCYPAMLEIEGPSICIEFCSGSLDDPQCSDPDQVCAIDRQVYDFELGCLPRCDLLAPECGAGTECLPLEVDDPESTAGFCGVKN
jgi:hypothetical protein